MVLLLILVVVLVFVAFRLFRLARADGDLSLLRALASGIPKESFEDKVVWVTGASSGIGEAIAIDLAARGARLVLSARRVEELERVKGLCKGKNEASILILPLDLSDYKSHSAAVARVNEVMGGVDILINNAGRSQRALVETTDLEVDQAMLALNVIGTVSLTKAVLPTMLAQGSGHVVVISSVAGKMPAPVSASYSMSKHAIQGFFDTMRMELFTKNINVTMICPGPVKSQGAMNAFTGNSGERVGEHNIDDAKKMTAERCAELTAAAIAHKLDEAWISRQPILFFVYLFQYFPTIARRFGGAAAQPRIDAFRNGIRDINAGLNLKSLFFGKPKQN